MKHISTISVLLLFTFLPGCTNSTQQQLHSYKQSPEFIKRFMNTLHHGNFAIAERGERWESSCVRSKGVKSFQFISASINSSQYQLHFLGGGISGTHKETMIINFKDDKVISYKFAGIQDEFRVLENKE